MSIMIVIKEGINMWILLTAVFWGLVGYSMAESRDRNKWLGLIGGLLFGFIPALYYLIRGYKDIDEPE